LDLESHRELATLMQRFMKQSNDNGYTACNAGLERQVKNCATQQNRT
jgi:hypothetical protein